MPVFVWKKARWQGHDLTEHGLVCMTLSAKGVGCEPAKLTGQVSHQHRS